MKKIHQLSFRMQIFLSSLILIILPTVLLCTINAVSRTATITSEYNTSTAATLTQMNQSLDTLLENASKVADTPLLNDDARKAMITNYGENYLAYAQDFNIFRNLMRQTNRLNSSMLTVYFQNRYGYSFDYNVKTAQQRHTIENNIEKWKKIAKSSKSHTYFAPLLTDSNTGQSILPMVKILLDGYDYQETGLCYVEIDFSPIMEILSSTSETQNTLLIYNTDNKLIRTINLASFSDAEISSTVLTKLEDFSNTLTSQDTISQSTLKTSFGQFVINGCINNTTQWHIVQIISNEKITHIFRDTIVSYLGIFLSCTLLGLILAGFLSRILTRPVFNLCHEIDVLDPSDGAQIDLRSCGSNQELCRLINSFNKMSQRLFLSLKQNYEIQITEQQMRVQMLQFQINHHFLHNTLNVIKSLAEIHNVPEIETIATCMSELVRYNLEKFPVATLQEELQQVQRYMSIQNIRFPGKFCYDINIPSEFLQMNIPVFLFQPLVENSVEHGFSNRVNECYISISCQLENDCLHFLVADNGSGMTPEQLKDFQDSCNEQSPISKKTHTQKHHSIGLANVNQRLRSYYGEKYGLSVESIPGEGTIIDIVLPSSAMLMSKLENNFSN